MTDNISEILKTMFPDEWNATFQNEMLARTPAGASPGPDEYVGAVDATKNALIVRHLDMIAGEYERQQGRAVDTMRLQPSYLEALNKAHVTHDQVVEAAQRFYPDLSPREALAKWTQKAAGATGNKDGVGNAAGTAEEHYWRTGRWPTRESNG